MTMSAVEAMTMSAVPVTQTPLPRTAALPEMATAVLILDEDRRVEYVNDSAKMLFAPIDPSGCTLPALFASCGATGGEDVFAPIDGGVGTSTVRIRMTDDRLLECSLRLLSSGGFVMSMDDVTELARIAEMAQHDALTGLANRSALHTQLAERLQAATLTNEAVAVLYIDLDRFKSVNDTLGHPIGDILLRKVAERCKSALREGDVVARLGGDEFAVIQSGAIQPEGATSLAARLVDLIGRAYAIEGHMLHIAASIGVALFPDDGREPDDLFKNADLALYRAKAEGRGCYRFYEPGMDERMQARRAMEIDLRRALALKQLEVEYQPQIELSTNRIVGFEALIRWHHPERGRVSPADFIPLAEEIGVIVPIGEWVLRTACKQAADWPEPVSIAVNLSPLQFRGGKVVETIMSALAHSGLEASRLEVEITEGALLDNSEDVMQVLNGLRSLGVRVSMDDFGTGYSSLGYLQKFLFDKVKIDQSFVRGIDASPQRRAIVLAIITLASALGMKTTAEGVETDAELECIRSAGCTAVQGYLTGRPQSGASAAALLEGRDSMLASTRRAG
jgi:diguanylate cyclase (GGDEF)-like protein